MQPLKVVSDNSTVYNSPNNKLDNSKMEIKPVNPDRALDQKLVEKAQKGDKQAFGLLVEKYQLKLYRLISRMVRDQSEIDDIVQDSFIKAYRAIGNFRGDSAFYTWLYRIAINTAKNHLVSRSRRPPGSDVELEDAEYFESGGGLRTIETPENALFGEELKAVVQDAISALSEDLRTAITLREFDGLSYEDIADIMDCPVGTVRSRISRAREAIDVLVCKQMDGEA